MDIIEFYNYRLWHTGDMLSACPGGRQQLVANVELLEQNIYTDLGLYQVFIKQVPLNTDFLDTCKTSKYSYTASRQKLGSWAAPGHMYLISIPQVLFTHLSPGSSDLFESREIATPPLNLKVVSFSYLPS